VSLHWERYFKREYGEKEMQKMKRRAAYAAFEKTILDLYERKLLTLNLLDRVASQYRLVALDSAGSQYVLARDGKDLLQICIGLIDPTFPVVARGARGDHEEYWERELKKWESIVHGRWDWQRYCTAFAFRGQQNKAA
jgi:hypothetical protein